MEKLLNRIIEQIVYLVEPYEIILFGSFASGNQQVNSDIDLLIIADEVHHGKKITKEISDFIAQYGYRSDILLRNKSDVEIEMTEPKSFLYNALKKSKKIYKKS